MDSNDIDDALDVLADRQRREVLEYLIEETSDWATIEELAEHLASPESKRTNGARTEKALETRLYHVHVPKLEEYGFVEYDARSGAVRDSADEQVGELLTTLRTEF